MRTYYRTLWLQGALTVSLLGGSLMAAVEVEQQVRGSPLSGAGLRGTANYTAEERKELDALEEMVRHFSKESEEHRAIVRQLIEDKYSEKRKFIFDQYESQINELEQEQRKLRSQSIERFEQFIRTHPTQERYTPDAMFRLSELYFEKAYDDYLAERVSYDRLIEQWDPQSNTEEPVLPDFHYDKSVETMERLVANFPNYRLIDGAYYLLGYCLSEMGKSNEAVSVYEELVAKNPASRFASEVWTRIGNHYFDHNNLDKAQYAFEQVLGDTESAYFDKGLYKLAWTHYRKADSNTAPEEFQKAVDMFFKLLDFNESTKQAGNERGQDLRPEAIQYIAISFADEDWGGLKKLTTYMAQTGQRDYERDLLMSLAGVYFDQTRYGEAIESLELVQRKFPSHFDAPVAQNKIIEALERTRDFERAARARSFLSREYVEDGPWFEKNKDNEEAVVQARKLIAKSLYNAAIFYHGQAQKYRSGGKLELAMNSYKIAADSYQAYLNRFPHDKQLYELTFYLAECLYYSTRFMDAAAAYEEVRDAYQDRKYRKDSALSLVLAYEKEALFAVKRGELEPLELRGVSERSEEGELEAREIPKLRLDFIEASDSYENYVSQNDSNLPGVLYKAAEVFYGYAHFEEARKRFLDILNRFPADDIAVYASNLVIESYLSEKKYNAVEQFTRKLLEDTAGDLSQRKDFYSGLVKFKTGAMFKRAEQLATAGEFEESSKLYEQLVYENPDAEFADVALNNAAVGYEKVKRYDSAAKLYERIVTNYPKSTLASTALFRVALNAERFFDFDRAISTYNRLIKDYPRSENRADAVYNAALALENTQQYDASAKLYETYCRLFPKREDAPVVCFRAGAVYEKMGDLNRVIKTYKNFVGKYGNTKAHQDRIVEAYLRIAKTYEKMSNGRTAVRFYEKAVQAAKGYKDEKSITYGAEAQFQLVERDFKRFAELRIKGSAKAQKKGLVRKLEALKKVEASYKDILKFKQLDWTLASLFRIGALYQNVAETFINAPCPKEIKRSARELDMTVEEVCEEYVALLEEQAMSIEDKAVTAYEVTISRAREFQIANEWTKRTLVELNRLRKSEWPLQKDAKFFLDTNAIETLPFVDTQGKKLASPQQTTAGGEENAGD